MQNGKKTRFPRLFRSLSPKFGRQLKMPLQNSVHTFFNFSQRYHKECAQITSSFFSRGESIVPKQSYPALSMTRAFGRNVQVLLLPPSWEDHRTSHSANSRAHISNTNLSFHWTSDFWQGHPKRYHSQLSPPNMGVNALSVWLSRQPPKRPIT